nr:ribonuclease H-like domain-containing protein [Tanacetum cinerariifolium]
MIKVLPPKTNEEVVAREKERKARTTLLMALPEDHLEKFHKMADAKEMVGSYQIKRVCIKGTTASSSNIQNVAFVSTENTSSTNDVSTAYSVSSAFVSKSQKERSSSYTDEVIHSFFENQSSAPQLNYDDLEQINDDDMEKMDLKWQVAMISIRIEKFYKRTSRKLQFDTKDLVGFDKTKMECFNCHKMGHFARDCKAKGNQDSRRRDDGYNGNKARDNGKRPAYQDDSKALVTIDGEDIDWSGHVEEDPQNYVMMAYSFSNSGSNNEVKSCYKTCEESYARLKKLYDEQRNKLGDASVAITAYTLALKKLEAQLLCHQQNQLAYEQKIRFGLGYGDYRYGSILSYENEVLQSVFMNKESDLENTSVNDRYAIGMHAVPPPMTGNYMPSGPDVEIDYSKFTYGPKQTSIDESDSKHNEYASCESDSSLETTTSMPKPEENAPKVVCKPKVWIDAPIIEKYDSDSDNDSMSNDDPHRALKDKGIVDSGCSRHMTGNRAHLVDYQEFKGGFVAFGGSNGKISGKGKIKADRLDFKDVYYVEELKHYNLFFVSQMCDKKNKVLFINIDCLVLSPDFKLPDENQLKGINREYSNARTPQQNKVAERKNKTLIEAARTIKELASPKQTALGKYKLNLFMAGSLPKTICYKLMLFGLSKDVAVNLMLLVIDFLNGHVIQYALMVNPTIYISCIKKFWALATIKKVNDVVKLRALIDEKWVVVTEDVIRQALHLDDADGVECFPNEEIFTELARI